VPELIADMFVSVDGYARGARSPGYFGFGGPDLERWIRDEMARPQRLVMGRRTYSALAGIPESLRDQGWQRMSAMPTLVFSRTLQEASWPGATVIHDDVVEHVSAVKDDDGPDLRTVGSLSVVQQLLRAGLVDRLRLLVFPLIIGETGQEPFFAQLPDLAMELVDHAVLDRRVILSDYRPAGRPPYAG
jgi:dihydrofolate reductase